MSIFIVTRVQSTRRFRVHVGSEHTPDQSIHRFRATPDQSIHRIRAYTGSETRRFKAYAGSETRKFTIYASSETQRFRYLVVKSIEPTKILRFKLNKTQDYEKLILL